MTTATRDSMVGDRYHLTARVSAGGMGEVYRARDTVLGRTVAVKVLPEALSLDPDFVERFRAEAQAVAKLSHPNVVHVYDWGRWESIHYMVMEFVRGRNLRSVLAAHHSLSPPAALEVISQVLSALSAAHDGGLVHRDVKPENILIATDGTVKVTDFGIARATLAAATGGMFGTVAYVSPEQVRGEAVDARADIYSAGCLLYELICGVVPFAGDGAAVLHSHLTGRVPPPSSERSDVPEEVDRIVARATEPSPEDRYLGAREMLEDVRSAITRSDPPEVPLSELVNEVTSEVSESAMPTITHERSRSPRRVALITLSATILAFMVFAAILWRPTRVPELLGMDLAQAMEALEESGLASEVNREFSDQPPESVLEASPTSGSWTLRGRTVSLTVSRGPLLTTIPDLVGQDLTEARQALRGAGLLAGDINQVFSPEPSGTVVGQDPGPGRARTGEPVNLSVSKGPEMVAVPEVVGKTRPQAEAALRAAGLSASVEEVFDDSKAGTVLSQSPKAKERVEKGSTVALGVSKGPEPFDMPDVDGKACSAARDQLEELGLVVVIRSQSDSNCSTNRVLDQDPLPGAEVRKGDEATLYVE